jgi:hypothetical protein
VGRRSPTTARSEYFLWRRAFMDDQRYISEATLRAASG